VTALVRFPTGGALPQPANDDNAKKLPGCPVRGWDSLLAWLRAHPEYRNSEPGVYKDGQGRVVNTTNTKSMRDTALDFVAFQMVEANSFPDWRRHEVAEWAYDIMRNGYPKLSERLAREWLREQTQEEDANDPIDWRPELEEYFKRDAE
jgi:hypothetical protein